MEDTLSPKFRIVIEKFKGKSDSGYNNYDKIYEQILEDGIDLMSVINAFNKKD